MKKDELRRGKSSGLVRQPSISRTGRVIKPTESAKAWQEQKDMPTNGNRLNRYTHIYKIYSTNCIGSSRSNPEYAKICPEKDQTKIREKGKVRETRHIEMFYFEMFHFLFEFV